MSKPLHIVTPLLEIPAFNLPGKRVRFKMDPYQPAGSFKIRGIGHTCRKAKETGASRILASSGGNAGLAAAYAARELGLPITVVVPSLTAPETVAKLRAFGAEVIVHGDFWDQAHSLCLEMQAADPGITYIHPFDMPDLWEGHASLVDELAEQCDSQPDLIITSVGGGGLMRGIVEGLHRNGWDSTHVLAVETPGCDSLRRAMEAGELVPVDKLDTVAKSLAARQVCQAALDCTRTHTVIPCVVEDARAVAGCVKFLDEAHTLVEAACGAPVAVVMDNMEVLAPYQNIVVECCGGNSVTMAILNAWREQFGV